MALVIAHAELVSDQTSDPRTAPQRRREAVRLGAFQQQRLEAFELRGVQQRLTAGAAGLAQPGFAVTPVSSQPLADALPRDLQSPRCLGLTTALLDQPDRFETALLQGLEIPPYAFCISHTYKDVRTPKRCHFILRDSIGPIDQDLWALPFSLETLTPTGEPFPFVQAARSPTAAADGTLVYFDRIRAVEQLTWFDRQGTRIGEVGQGQVFPRDLSLSPDGRRVAVSARENGNQDIWVHDMERGVKTRVTTDSSTEYRAIWSPDGEEIAFVHTRSTGTFRRRADGGGEERKLIETAADPGWISDWSVDGKYILYSISERGFDLWYGERNQDGDYEPHLFLQTPFSERTPKLSPDGRFIVYTSDASGRDEIYVQPFPEGGRRTTVSSNGGQNPRWSRDGRELFYTEGSTLVAVAVAPGPTFSARSKEYLFEHPMFAWPYMPQYDVSPDGKRFIIPTPVEADPDAKPMIRVVQNWVEEFREHKPD